MASAQTPCRATASRSELVATVRTALLARLSACPAEPLRLAHGVLVNIDASAAGVMVHYVWSVQSPNDAAPLRMGASTGPRAACDDAAEAAADVVEQTTRNGTAA